MSDVSANMRGQVVFLHASSVLRMCTVDELRPAQDQLTEKILISSVYGCVVLRDGPSGCEVFVEFYCSFLDPNEKWMLVYFRTSWVES